jgi:hypothetical protein
LGELVAAAGLNHPRELKSHHFMRRTGADRTLSFTELYRLLEPGDLLAGTNRIDFREAWEMASADSFAIAGEATRTSALAAE